MFPRLFLSAREMNHVAPDGSRECRLRNAPPRSKAAQPSITFVVSCVMLLVLVEFAAVRTSSAEEVDAVIADANRSFTRMKREKNPDEFSYGRLKLDSKGRVVGTTNLTGVVTKQTKVVMGKYDDKKMTWSPGAPIAGGVDSEMFKTKGKTLRVSVFTGDDKRTILGIIVKNTDEKLEKSDKEYHALFKQIGASDGYGTTIWYIRRELDDAGNVVKTFGLTSGFVRKDTKIAMGKYDEQTKKWEAGEPLEMGLKADVFKDLGVKNVYVYMIPRDDRQGLAELLVTKIGD